MRFKNREQAAEMLAEKLKFYHGKNPLILAIPRGAVPMASILAEKLEGELDLVLVRKLGAPGHAEFAIGAIDETGIIYLNPEVDPDSLPTGYLEQIKSEEIATLQKRRKQYTPHHTAINPKDRIVIVVDDGFATGSTMIAALASLRQLHPKKLIAAAAVGPVESLDRLKGWADEVVLLSTPEYFQAVGQFFEDFSQVEDEEVIAILEEFRARLSSPKR